MLTVNGARRRIPGNWLLAIGWYPMPPEKPENSENSERKRGTLRDNATRAGKQIKAN